MQLQNILKIKQHSVVTPLWHQFTKNKLAIAGLVFIILILLLSVFSNYITWHEPNSQENLVRDRYLAPSLEHPFGTDKFSRDVFSRVLYGGRISLTIAFSVVLLSLTIGLLYGSISGYLGGWFDAVMMRLLDFFLAFPAIFLIIAIVAIFRPDLWYFIIILSFTGWMEPARLIRAEVLSIKNRDFVTAAKGLGFGQFHILFKHVIPNSLTPLLVAAPLKIGEVILLESALSFLGIGVQPPTPSWGNIISDGKDVLLEASWIATFPGIFIVLTVMSFNFVGEAIRQSLGNHS